MIWSPGPNARRGTYNTRDALSYPPHIARTRGQRRRVRAAVGEQQRKWLEAVPTLKTPSSHPSYAALGRVS
jgi:hypothetical protein